MSYARRLLLSAALALGLSACGGADDPQELAEEVVGYLSEGDFRGYIENVVASPEQMLEVCPSLTSYRIDEGEHQKKFNECLARADFGSAEITQVLPTTGASDACGGAQEASEISITLSTDSAVYTFKIKQALETNDGWKITGTLSCPDK